MHEVRAHWMKSIFTRMVITFLLIILPLYALGIAIYHWAIQTQKENVSNTMLSEVSFYLTSLEREVERIKQLQYYCTTDDNLQQLSSIPESLSAYERVKSILLLQQRLLSIQSSSVYATRAGAWIPSLDKVVFSSSVEDGISTADLGILNVPAALNAQLIRWGDGYVVSAASAETEPGRRPRFILTVELSLERLRAALRQFNEYRGGGAVLVDDARGILIASADNEADARLIADQVSKADAVALRGSRTARIRATPYWVVYVDSPYLGITLAKFVPEREVLAHFQKYFIWLWVLTVTAVALILLYAFLTWRQMYLPLSLLVGSFRRMERGDLTVEIDHRGDDEFGYLYAAFNQMVEKLRALIDQAYTQKLLAQKAELKQLQAQINPHFLYNSYFILNRMVTLEDTENAARFSQQLGTYLKYITRNAGEEVPLSREVEHARTYAEIQAMRFSSRMTVDFGALPADLAELPVPRLIIQPLVENSIEHGLADTERGGALCVRFLPTETALEIVVEDNGAGMPAEELERLRASLQSRGLFGTEETTGLINIHRRLRNRYGDGAGLLLAAGASGGMRIVLRIPVAEATRNA
jgi:two-component system, sensor histidine kinase YesM